MEAFFFLFISSWIFSWPTPFAVVDDLVKTRSTAVAFLGAKFLQHSRFQHIEHAW